MPVLAGLLIILGVIWIALGLVNMCRFYNHLFRGKNGTLIFIICLVTHGVGAGLVMIGSLAYALWQMILFPFGLIPERKVEPLQTSFVKPPEPHGQFDVYPDGPWLMLPATLFGKWGHVPCNKPDA